MLVLSFVGVLLLSFVVIAVLLRPHANDRTVENRVGAIARILTEPHEEMTGLMTVERDGMSERLGEHLMNYRFAENLELLILHAGAKATVGSIAIMSCGLAMMAAMAAHLFTKSLPLVLLATAGGASLRYILLRMQKARRLKNFNAGLPDAIDLMARALRAGHAVGSSIEIISEQTVEPLKSEFASCFQQQKFGIPFRDAMLDMGHRVPSKDLHFMITAILVQKETGGDLTDILDRTARVIRERIRIEGEVKTYTAQGRMTGWILGLLPVIMLVLINFVTPGYSHILFYDPLGQKLLYAGATLIVIGGLIIRKIVDIQV